MKPRRASERPPAARVSLADRVQYRIVRALMRLSDATKVRLSGEPPIVIDGQLLDPEIQLLRALRRVRGAAGLVEPDHLTGRRRFRREMLAFAGPPTAVGAVRELSIPGPRGPQRARHYAPPECRESSDPESQRPAATREPADVAGDDGAPAPLTVYLHGGGFVIGDLEAVDEACRLLCRHGRTHVLSVDYRLAPEHPHPAALDDTRAALDWARANAGALGADPSRIAVGGDSAGANLATVAARLDVRDGKPLAAQLLIYPPTDSETPRPSWTMFATGFLFTAADREAFARLYLQGAGVRGDDPSVSPLLASDLGGLPPALVVTAGFDPLRDEGEAYAHALRGAGTEARLRRETRLSHGFVNIPGISSAARQALVRTALEWRSLLSAAPTRVATA